ncbi:MAG: DUF11 domain-containing protein [Actinobacteria bacterium]|nr:DUF11 domain-containing protein [Actinomycetota bacterium]
MTIAKAVSSATAKPGDTLTYTVHVVNTGEGTLTHVVITDPIPAGTTLIAATATDGPTLSGNTLTWTIPSLASGSAIDESFAVTVAPNAGSTVLNVAVADSDQTSPKDASALTTIKRTSVLGVVITKQVPLAPTTVAAATLPRTGGEDVPIFLVGLAMVGFGLSISTSKDKASRI